MSNSNGKTSASGVAGLSTTFVGLFGFLVGVGFFVVSKDATIMMYASALVGTGLGVLGYRKSKDANTSVVEDAVDGAEAAVDAIEQKSEEILKS